MTERKFDNYRKDRVRVRDSDNDEIGRLIATPDGEAILAEIAAR